MTGPGPKSRQAGRLYEGYCLVTLLLMALAIVIPKILGARHAPPPDVAPETTAATTSGS